MNIYSIKDSAADFWLPLFLARSDDQAIRMFVQSMGDNFKFRDDYALFRFGTFDDDHGVLVADESPTLVMHGSSLSPSLAPNFNEKEKS